jgi:type I restriction enzyme R subunit
MKNLIQAFSRTNRLYGDEKRFGIIKYYIATAYHARNIHEAVKAYSGDIPTGLFVDKLPSNLKSMNYFILRFQICSKPLKS